MKKTIVLMLVLALFSAMIVSAADYGLTSVSGIWTSVNGGSGKTGINTNEVRWGTPADFGGEKSGLRFDGAGTSSFNEGDEFLLGTLSHFNWPVLSGTAANGATLQITLAFSNPAVSPNPDFSFDFNVEETSNSAGHCPAWQVSGTPCDDKITFPSSYGEESVQIGDKLYTIKILGFVDSFPSGSPVSQFVTEEEKDNEAYLVGTLSSVLVEAPQITLVSKTVNGHSEESAPGLTLYVGDPITWEYLVQNTGNVALTEIAVTDDMGVIVSCPQATLAAGDSMTCTGTGTATLGQYVNTATATAKHASSTLTSDNKAAYYLGINTPVCGDGIINQANEVCETANTVDNSNCPQETTGCQDKKLGTRDSFGECNLNCICAPDSFENFQCVKGQCGAACSVDADCDDSNANTADSCLDDCTCKHEDITPSTFCGNGIVEAGEQCDYNNGLVCTPDCGSSCNYCDASCVTQTVNGDVCPPADVCGDSFITGTEQCDDGASNGIGCTPSGCGATCNYCDTDCTSETNYGGSCCDPATECCYAGAPGCGSTGVPYFTPITFVVAITIAGLGLAYLRKQN